MTATAYSRGHLIRFVRGAWRYADTDERDTNDRPCVRCGQPPTLEGYDPCLGYVPGAVSACCGHGVKRPYIKMGDRHE